MDSSYYHWNDVAGESAGKSLTIDIFPNPASDFIEISYSPSRDGAGCVSIEIYNVLSEIILSTPFNSPASGGQLKIDASGLDAGIYFV